MLQWFWLQDLHPGDDQWNSLHEKLVERWGELADRLPSGELHVTWSAADPTGEDHVTASYLQETAAEAGLSTVGLAIEEIGWDPLLERFVDLEEAPIHGGQALPVGVDLAVTAAGLVSMAFIVVVAIYNAGGQLLEWVMRLDIGALLRADRFIPASLVVASAHVGVGLVVAVAIS